MHALKSAEATSKPFRAFKVVRPLATRNSESDPRIQKNMDPAASSVRTNGLARQTIRATGTESGIFPGPMPYSRTPGLLFQDARPLSALRGTEGISCRPPGTLTPEASGFRCPRRLPRRASDSGLRLRIRQPGIAGDPATTEQIRDFFTGSYWKPFFIERNVTYFDPERKSHRTPPRDHRETETRSRRPHGTLPAQDWHSASDTSSRPRRFREKAARKQ